MLAQLPEPIKQQVMEYLQTNNFPAAKRLHDEWLRNNASKVVLAAEDSKTSISVTINTKETH